MVSNETLNEAARRLADRFHPRKIILFGSQARGTADRHSDVDLLVICDQAENRREMTYAMDLALRDLRIPADIMILTPTEFEIDCRIPGTIARPAWKEGKILYENLQ